MLRALIEALENTSVVHDDREAVRLLAASGCPPDVVDAVAFGLGDGSMVLRSDGERLVIYMHGDDWEGWFKVEPAGFRCLYRH
jgi:hypothetical protein